MASEVDAGAGSGADSGGGLDSNESSLPDTIWVRGLYMLLFLAFYAAAEAAVFLIAVFQFGSSVLTEGTNERLRRLSPALCTYIYEIVAFWTFASEQKPFPFSEWPAIRSGSEERC